MTLSSDIGIALLSEDDGIYAQQRYGDRTSERGGTEDTYELIIQVAWCMKLVTLMQLVQFYFTSGGISSGKERQQQ